MDQLLKEPEGLTKLRAIRKKYNIHDNNSSD
jgi:hypothetical protein